MKTFLRHDIRKSLALAVPLLWMAGATVAPAAVKVAGQMLVDLSYTRGITTLAEAGETRVTAWANQGLSGGAFTQAVDSPYGPAWVTAGATNIIPPFLTPNKGGAGINVPESAGGRSLVASFATPSVLQGNHPYSIEVWLWKNNDAADQRGVFAWTENVPVNGDAGKLTAGDPAALHNNSKDLTWGGLPTPNAWHHVVLTYDGITEKIYLDGALQNSAAKTLSISPDNYYPMLFSGIAAAAPSNTSFSLNGAIAALRVHTDALSAADVTTNKNEGISAVPVINVSILSTAATAVTGTTATLNGSLASTSDAASTALTFYYGTSDKGNTTTGWSGSATLAAPQGVGDFFAPISGLTPDTTYYVRIRGVNSGGDGWSTPVSFHTPGSPILTSLKSSLGLPGTATVSATLNPNGYTTDVKLYWGTTNGGTVAANWGNVVNLGTQPAGTVSSVLTGLNASATTYYYTFFASSSAGSTFYTPAGSFKTRDIPATGDLVFSALTEVLPESGPAGTWTSFLPAGQAFAPINGPTVKQFGGVKWIKNLAPAAQGFRLQDPAITGGNYVDSIPVNGASVVVAVKPLPRIVDGDPWSSIVDIFYNRLVVGMRNDTGQVQVWRNGTLETSTNTIPAGEVTVLSFVVQPTGEYKVWANGVEIMNNITTSDMTLLVPNVPGPYANAINIGRNQPDAWPVFNGHIGDVFAYKKALSDAERLTLETGLTSKFVTDATLSYPITATAGANGSISDPGSVPVLQGSDKTFTITANSGYVVGDIVVDGVSKGPALSYAFTDVSASHTISVSFLSLPPQTITASAGANGAISPSGAMAVNAGSDQTYAIQPASGYKIANVLVDGVSIGTPSSYTFKFVVAPHTIQATFAALSMNIPRSGELLFSAVTDDLPGDGLAAGNWPTYVPVGNLTAMGTPMVQVINGIKWVDILNLEGDGFQLGQYATAIPVDGITATVVIQPESNGTGDNWTSLIDVMYNRVVLGIRGTDGVISVWCNGVRTNGPAILSGQKTVLTLVVQPAGDYKVFANGIEVMNVAATAPMTSLDPLWQGGGTGYWSYINVGRNQPDGWTTYNGKIGDLFFYKTALSDADRDQLEDVLIAKYGIVLHTITSTTGINGTITPLGAVTVVGGTTPKFAITGNFGYAVEDVLVDGVSVGAVTSYTFPEITGDHTISATFMAADLYGDWVNFYYDPADPKAAKDADPDGDGQINLVEYALDGDPMSGVANPKLRARVEAVEGENALVITFASLDSETQFAGSPSKSLSVAGVTYTVEGSNGLDLFDQEVTEVPVSSEGLPEPFVGWRYRSFRLDGTVGGAASRGPKGFLRLRIENAGE